MSQKLFSTDFFSCLIASETSNRFSLSDYFENAYNREYGLMNEMEIQIYLLPTERNSVTIFFVNKEKFFGAG